MRPPAAVAGLVAHHPIMDPGVGALTPGIGLAPEVATQANRIGYAWRDDAARGGTDATALIDASPALQPASATALARSVVEAAGIVRDRGLVGPNTSVLTIGQVDYFARLLGARSPKGTALWQDEQRTFRLPDPVEARTYLLRVDAAFTSVCGLTNRTPGLDAAFKPALTRYFEAVPLTACWTLWRRRGH